MRKSLLPRGHGPARGAPPDPMALARRRAKGPPPNQARPSPHVSQPQPSDVKKNNRPSKLAQRGMDVMASLPSVNVVNGAAAVVEEEIELDNEVEDVKVEHGWIQMWDEEVESNYYYNQLTGEASWIRPEEVAEDVGTGDSIVSSLGGASIVDEWDRYWDDEAAAYYLHNATTGETKWENDHEGASYEAEAKY